MLLKTKLAISAVLLSTSLTSFANCSNEYSAVITNRIQLETIYSLSGERISEIYVNRNAYHFALQAAKDALTNAQISYNVCMQDSPNPIH